MGETTGRRLQIYSTVESKTTCLWVYVFEAFREKFGKIGKKWKMG